MLRRTANEPLLPAGYSWPHLAGTTPNHTVFFCLFYADAQPRNSVRLALCFSGPFSAFHQSLSHIGADRSIRPIGGPAAPVGRQRSGSAHLTHPPPPPPPPPAPSLRFRTDTGLGSETISVTSTKHVLRTSATKPTLRAGGTLDTNPNPEKQKGT